MTLDEFYELSREECILRIKDECRSQAKKRMLFGAIFLLWMAILIFLWIKLEQVRILYVCQLSVFCIAAAWIAVNNFRLLHRVNSLDTPEQLLHLYEKTMNNNRRAYYLAMLGLIGNLVDPYAFIRSDWEWGWILVDLTILVATLAFLIYSYFKGDYLKYKTDRDEDIIMRLHDLIDMK